MFDDIVALGDHNPKLICQKQNSTYKLDMHNEVGENIKVCAVTLAYNLQVTIKINLEAMFTTN